MHLPSRVLSVVEFDDPMILYITATGDSLKKADRIFSHSDTINKQKVKQSQLISLQKISISMLKFLADSVK